MTLALTGIVLSLVLLITLAYRGHSVVAVAPVAALIAVIFSGAPVLASYTQVFMPALAGFITSFFPLFLTGAIFGKLMTLSGFARQLAAWISRLLGPNQAILVTVLATALLTYGGVSAWVVVFTIFPIATALFEEADIPRRLMPAAIALGIFTFATAALPGSPQIHNAIPTRYFGTNTFAAPILGLIGATVVFGLGMAWLTWRRRQLQTDGESFYDPTDAELRDNAAQAPKPSDAQSTAPQAREEGSSAPGTQPGPGVGTTTLTRTAEAGPQGATTASGMMGLAPILVVVAVNALMTYAVLPAMDTDYLADERFGGTSLAQVAGIWSVTVGMVAGILVIFAMRPGNIREFVDGLSAGAKNAVLPVFTTASEVGYGAVIASLAVFAAVRDGIFGLSDNALITSVLSVSGISGLTGSASGGLTIALETFGEDLSSGAAAQGISMELMHRATAMASTGFDSLPHNGAIITLLLVCGLTHRESYKDIGVVTVVVPVIGVLLVAGLGLTVGAF
jgi:H+/gluconate symporter-like permease